MMADLTIAKTSKLTKIAQSQKISLDTLFTIQKPLLLTERLKRNWPSKWRLNNGWLAKTLHKPLVEAGGGGFVV